MTEQEKREKAIEEREEQIENEAFRKHTCSLNTCHKGNCWYCARHRLAVAGYRKEEEVRKETAKEILHELKNLLVEPWKSYELCEDDLRRIAERFGVEEEE